LNLTFFAPWLPWQRSPFWICSTPLKLPHTTVANWYPSFGCHISYLVVFAPFLIMSPKRSFRRHIVFAVSY
jgi:hypothetical protein